MKEAVNSMQKMLKNKYKEEWAYRVSDFEVLEEVAKATGSITEFITEYILDPKAETTFKYGVKTVDDVVTLSTIHSAKGLEAKIVHVIDVNPFNYPTTHTIRQGKDAIEEERRCFYVALTRAKDKLNLYRFTRSLHTQYIEDGREENLYFLNMLPKGLVNIIVNGQKKSDFPDYSNLKQVETKFPDFNFE